MQIIILIAILSYKFIISYLYGSLDHYYIHPLHNCMLTPACHTLNIIIICTEHGINIFRFVKNMHTITMLFVLAYIIAVFHVSAIMPSCMNIYTDPTYKNHNKLNKNVL